MSEDDGISGPYAEASRWFRFAEEDLRTALACLHDSDVPPRQACYFAQQAAEKALKGCLIACGTDYPRSHDLDYLRNLLPPTWRIHAIHPVLAELTEWLVEARYPGDWPDPTEAEARSAIEMASAVLIALRADLAELI
ncbi:MAG: HEPN domain-containing protein [Anaerolinea sp.]|nr:HEPN domain-containing protein [Anaerolinea sp.]